MNKGEFVTAISAHRAITKKDAKRFSGSSRTRSGTVSRKTRALPCRALVYSVEESAAPYRAQSATSLEIQIPARLVVKFKAAKETAEAVA